MKFRAMILALSPAVTFAAGPLPNAFPDAKIGIPRLSLSEVASQGVPSLLAGSAAEIRKPAPPLAPPKRVSHMPIIAPRPDLEPKIRIVEPDTSVDYKIIVKTPDVEPAK